MTSFCSFDILFLSEFLNIQLMIFHRQCPTFHLLPIKGAEISRRFNVIIELFSNIKRGIHLELGATVLTDLELHSHN